MYCPRCGAYNDDKASYCNKCGHYLSSPAEQPPDIPTYLAQAILATVFCCVPFGIVAIVYAAQVNSKLTAGDYAGAREVSNKAREWSWISLISGLVVGFFYFILVLAG